MSRTPSAFPFSGRLRRRAINPTPPKRVKAWGWRPPEARGDVLIRCCDMGLSMSRIWAVASVKASDAPSIVPAYGGFCVAVVHSMRLIIITAVFAGAGLLRVRWSIIWSWWLFWFSSSIYSTRLLRSTCIISSVMWGRAVHFYTSINVLLGFAGYANRCIVAVHCLGEVRVYVRVPIFDFLAHQHCAHDWENHIDSQVDLVVLLIIIFLCRQRPLWWCFRVSRQSPLTFYHPAVVNPKLNFGAESLSYGCCGFL